MFRSRPRQPVAQAGGVALVHLRDLTRAEWRQLHDLYRSAALAAWNAARPTRLPRWLFRMSLLAEETGGERAGFGVLSGGAFIGTAELYDLTPPLPAQPERGTLGVMLAPPYWNQGYGRRAVEALLDVAFSPPAEGGLGLGQVRLMTLAHNVRAQRSFAAGGFRETSRSGTEVFMEQTRAEWAGRQPVSSGHEDSRS